MINTPRAAASLGRRFCASEIGNFDPSIKWDENIFWFDISMDDVLRMNVSYSTRDLVEDFQVSPDQYWKSLEDLTKWIIAQVHHYTS